MHPNDNISTKRVLLISFIVDLLDISTNLVVSLITGSAVVFTVFVQGIADSIGSSLLVIGYYNSKLPRDERHPHGHAREIFFWALLSSTVMLFFGSGLSIWRGLDQLFKPQPLEYKWIALTVLIVSLFSNGYSFSQGLKKIYQKELSLLQAFHQSSRQLVKTSLIRDCLGTISAFVGLISILLYDLFGIILFDAIGAIVIGCLIILFAVILIIQSKYLIVGQSVPKEIHARIRIAVKSVPEVFSINKISAIYSGSDQIYVDLDIDLKDDLKTSEIEKIFDKIHLQIVKEVSNVVKVHIDLNSPIVHS
jgi:cation diffusion facilitator family transporter